MARSTAMLRRTRLRVLLGGTVLLLAACGQSPEAQQGRGLVGGGNVVIVFSVAFIVVAGGIIAAAVAYDRFVRSRAALQAAAEEPEPEEEEEEEEAEVAGIGMGTGAVPRWLYAAYVLIPTFAIVYVVTNVQVAEPRAEAPEETPAETEAPSPGRLEITGKDIRFDTDELVAPAGTEVTLVFHNEDEGIPHNVAIYESEEAQKDHFVGEIFNGTATEEYTFETPSEVGEYFFQCDVHPNSMRGTFVVEEEGAAPEEGEEAAGAPTSVEISAKDIAFDTDELTLAADTQTEITFENNDSGIPHNVAIYESEAAQDDVFVGDIFNGVETRTYSVPAIESGEYYFQCDVHPNMNGTLVVEEAGGGG